MNILTKQELKCYIKENVKAYRNKRKLTQEALAEMAGISSAYCAQIETGVRIPTTFVLIKIADALDVPLDVLVREKSERAKHLELEYMLSHRSEKQLEFLIGFVNFMDQAEW